MVCKVSLSRLFGDVKITDEFIKSMLGKPITYNGRTIGVITWINTETDRVHMDIDDWYRSEFEKDTSIEFIVCR